MLVEFGHLAEQSGWDGVFLEDYIVWQGQDEIATHDPWVTLTAIALQTARIRLGTLVTPLPRRRPWKLARETVALDHLSHGRLILGVGIGDTVSQDASFTYFNEELTVKKRAEMLDEALEVLVGLWSGNPFTYAGKHYRVNNATLRPGPFQEPRIPIWVGGGYPLTGPVERAARWDGSCLYKHEDHFMVPEDVVALRKFVEDTRGTLEGYDIAVGGSRRRDDWEEERAYIKSLADAGITWWMEYVPPQEPEAMKQAIEQGPLLID